jgi:hypothetical protein
VVSGVGPRVGRGPGDPGRPGDPQSPRRWTCKSTTQLAKELTRQGHPVSPRPVGRLLRAAGSRLQSNRTTKEGGYHPDRNAQFEPLSDTVKAFQRRGQPVIPVDTKKKELVGEFKNGGREWQPWGEPEEVLVTTSGPRNSARPSPTASPT